MKKLKNKLCGGVLLKLFKLFFHHLKEHYKVGNFEVGKFHTLEGLGFKCYKGFFELGKIRKIGKLQCGGVHLPKDCGKSTRTFFTTSIFVFSIKFRFE